METTAGEGGLHMGISFLAGSLGELLGPASAKTARVQAHEAPKWRPQPPHLCQDVQEARVASLLPPMGSPATPWSQDLSRNETLPVLFDLPHKSSGSQSSILLQEYGQSLWHRVHSLRLAPLKRADGDARELAMALAGGMLPYKVGFSALPIGLLRAGSLSAASKLPGRL